jgi:predicted RNA-binding Zn ribbon-like protein
MRFLAERDEAINAIVPLAESAADFLLSAIPSLLKKCENPSCVLHFYDTSKNHARRWCSMSGCGNRMKAAAHYRRQRRHEA